MNGRNPSKLAVMEPGLDHIRVRAIDDERAHLGDLEELTKDEDGCDMSAIPPDVRKEDMTPRERATTFLIELEALCRKHGFVLEEDYAMDGLKVVNFDPISMTLITEARIMVDG